MQTNVTQLRQEFIRATSTWSADSKPEDPKDVFFLESHMRALDLDRPLVIGMRGAGKSFWSHVLCNESLRPILIRSIAGYDKLTAVYPVRWDQEGTGFSIELPESSALNGALEGGIESKLAWLSLFLTRLKGECQRYGIQVNAPNPDEHGWLSVFCWAKDHPDAVRSALGQLDKALVTKGKCVLIVIDALDRIAGRLTQGICFLSGLLEVLLDARYLKGLKFKAFLREDMGSLSSALSFPDASKLLNEAPRLDWSREEIYALHFHKLAQKSQHFQQLLEQNFGPPRQKTPYVHDVLMGTSLTVKEHADKLGQVLKLFSPPFMGKTATKGRVYSWWYKHLADGKGRVSPRTFSAAFSAALKGSKETTGALEHVLTPKGIQQGLRDASDARVAELKEDYFWIETALEAFKDRSTPVEVKFIYGMWNGGGAGEKRTPVPTLIRDQCRTKKSFVPWDDDRFMVSPSQNLRDTLVELGILILRNEETRLDMPDIYRLGYKISKKGGVSPRKQH